MLGIFVKTEEILVMVSDLQELNMRASELGVRIGPAVVEPVEKIWCPHVASSTMGNLIRVTISGSSAAINKLKQYGAM